MVEQSNSETGPASPNPTAEQRFTNRLIHSTSPYLLQHAHNPVDWYPWGKEAIEKARGEDKPIFLSIGYSACHWCHVMEREVFENPDIASLMNQHFVNIKVDREERPDLDELYMLATQLMSGSGGWPMSVWLAPNLEPFYAGTYFPPVDGYGRPGFPRLVLAIADSWKNRRVELEGQSQRVVEAIRMHADESASGAAKRGAGPVDWKGWFARAIEQFADKFDETNGGLGASPKFPPHQALRLWLAMLRSPSLAQLSSSDVGAVEQMVTRTLDGMMRGGIYDHVGGGFARYSTDERWLVPHFEKMLYDNAQLAPAYAFAAVQLGRPDYARVAKQTLDFWLREMRSPEGAMFSTLDADSEGAEGKFYVWTVDNVRAALPSGDDADLIIKHFGITREGNWHESPVDGGNVLAIAKAVEDLAGEYGTEVEVMQKRIDALLQQMRSFRSNRVPPGLDDKVLTSWNGLMISALAICSRELREPKYLEAAHRAIGFLLTHHMEAGRRLLRVSRHGKMTEPPLDAFLEDHAYLLNGLMDLIDSTTPSSLPGTMARKRALELADTLIRDFADTEHGGFFFTSSVHDNLFARMKNAADNATPSANGMAIRALLRLARSSGKEQYHEIGMQAVGAFSPNIERRPDYFPTILESLLEDMETVAKGANLGIGDVAAGDSAPGEGLSGAVGSGALPAILEEQPVRETPMLSLEPIAIEPVRAGTPFEVGLDLAITEGHHIQPNKPEDPEVFATVARLRGDVPLASQEWSYPLPYPVSQEGTAAGYSGRVRFVAKCLLAEKTPPGRYTLRATVLAQPCSGTSCFPPEKVSVDFPLVVLPA
ncbi:MAG TPA: thioredoxin domain-containing protein [Phycisphaerae bacterium]|nr:thioredoxin domain-containing protein [Phycisphaerae bacterium]